MNSLNCALFIMTTFTLAGLVQIWWLASRISDRLAIPLDFGKTFRGKRLFGHNKMVRGFVVMVPASGVAFGAVALVLESIHLPAIRLGLWPLSTAAYLLLGFWAGFGFMAGELPNSFVKRQLGISSGQRPQGKAAAILSFIVDQCDSSVGMLIALSLIVRVPWQTAFYVVVFGLAIHWVFTFVLFRLGGKDRPA